MKELPTPTLDLSPASRVQALRQPRRALVGLAVELEAPAGLLAGQRRPHQRQVHEVGAFAHHLPEQALRFGQGGVTQAPSGDVDCYAGNEP